MNNNHSNRFFDGLFLGAVLGGAMVFLLGTKTGRNLLKIISEQGIDGLVNVLEEYDLSDLEEEEEEPLTNGHLKQSESTKEEANQAPKKRFFKRGKS